MSSRFSTRFTFPDKRLWFGKARLYDDHIELTGWNLTGRYKRTIPLSDVDKVEWWTGDSGANFALNLSSDEKIALRMRQAAAAWKFEIDSMLGQSSFEEAALPGESSPKDAAA